VAETIDQAHLADNVSGTPERYNDTTLGLRDVNFDRAAEDDISDRARLLRGEDVGLSGEASVMQETGKPG
jgi:hypothetical protein